MPAPLDLAGARLGQLVVVERGGRCHYGKPTWLWLCRCDCGAIEAIPQPRLACRDTDRRAARCCSTCARPPCVICGQPVVNRARGRRTCSDECRLAHTRSIQRACYHRHATDPAWRAHQQYNRLARREASPEAAERERQSWRIARQRRAAAPPEEQERRRARARAAYARDAAVIQARRRERLDAMAADQIAAWIDRARAYGRAYRRRWRAELIADPAAHQSYLDLMAEYRRRRALLGLLAEGGALETDNA